MHGISYRPTDLSLLKEFSKKSVLKIFIILFEQDCPEAVVHGCKYNQKYLNTTYLCNTIVFLHLGQFWQLLSFFGVKKEGLRRDIGIDFGHKSDIYLPKC